MKRQIKEYIIRSIILLVGLTIAHLGVTLFLISDLGADPFNVLVQGVFRTLSSFFPILTHGRTHIAISLIIIIILLIVDKSYIKLGTVLCMVFGGPIIDMFNALIGGPLSKVDHMAGRVIMLVAGCVILAYGMTIVIKSEAGTGPNDLVAVVISDKKGSKFSITRIIVDAAFLLTGFLLGGQVGLGTIVCMALVGPVAGIFLPVNERLIKKIMSKV
ncbi:MAG: hypothetical protein IJM23_07620 [Lachnospiraceae bacterium]|nr:hypothetical protein [Lachnospiraceae bacterium]